MKRYLLSFASKVLNVDSNATNKYVKDKLSLPNMPASEAIDTVPNCWICLENAAESDKQLMHQGCACRGSSGHCHVECLAEYASRNEYFVQASEKLLCSQWLFCPMCLQQHSGPFRLALAQVHYEKYKDIVKNYSNQEAIKRYQDALKHKVFAHLAESDYEKALPFAQTLLEVQKTAEACELVGHCLRGTGRLDDALAICRDGIDLFKEEFRVPTTESERALFCNLSYGLAMAHLKRDEFSQVIETWRNARRVLMNNCGKENHQYMSVCYNLGLFLLECGQKESGSMLLKEWKELATRLLGTNHRLFASRLAFIKERGHSNILCDAQY